MLHFHFINDARGVAGYMSTCNLAIQFCCSVCQKYRYVACQCTEPCGSRPNIENVVHKEVGSQVNARSAAGGITVDLSNMRNVTIDPVQQTAVAQGVLFSA